MHVGVFELVSSNHNLCSIPESWIEEQKAFCLEVFGEQKREFIDSLSRTEKIDDNLITFTENMLQANWKNWCCWLDNLKKFDYNSFKSGLDYELDKLKRIYSDQFDSWFLCEGLMYTISDMERIGGTYLIGRVWDCHL